MHGTITEMAPKIEKRIHTNGTIETTQAKISWYENKQNKVDICPTDPQNSYFKQHVPNIILNLKVKKRKTS